MLRHSDIWAAIDRVANEYKLSASGLARRAGLDPTTFNKSKRFSREGKPRWPSTESVPKILSVTGLSFVDFAAFAGGIDHTDVRVGDKPAIQSDRLDNKHGAPEHTRLVDRPANTISSPPSISVSEEIEGPKENRGQTLAIKLQEIGFERNILEFKLRVFVKRNLKAHFGASNWINQVLSSLPNERREKLAGIGADTILDKHIYFLDLINVIRRNWEKFDHLEKADPQTRVSKSQLITMLEFINSQRADAHAKEIAQSDLVTFRITIQSLHKIIDLYLDD